MSRLILFSLLCFSAGSIQTNGAKILGLYTFDMRSHYLIAQTLLKELANDGHDVTVITGFKTGNLPSNYKEISINLLTLDDFKKEMAKGQSIFGFLVAIYDWIEYSRNNTRTIILNEELQAMIHSNKTFDVILMGFAESAACFGLSQVFQAPIILTSTIKLNYFMEPYSGAFAHDSFITNILLPFEDEMNYYQRVINTIANWVLRFIGRFFISRQAIIYQELIPEPKPDFYDMLRSSVKVILVNSHFSLNKPLPYLTNMIEVGGLQIPDKINPLPEALQTFIDEATDGVIYFCMGGTLKTDDFDLQKRTTIINTLSKLKQKIILKWDNPNSINVDPKFLYVSRWLPQNDILANFKVKLYVTHGGMLSTSEAIYHGVPIVGIPVFGDQQMNMAKYKSLGFAVTVDFSTLTEESLSSAINEVLTNITYKNNAKKLSKLFRDRPMTGLQTAKYWVEYLMRHKNEDFFHSPGKKLNFIQYLNLDVYGLLLIILCMINYMFWKIFKCSVKKIFYRKKKQVKTTKNE